MGIVLLGTSLALAFWFGRRIATPVLALTGSAAALGRGGIVRPLNTPVAEVNAVSRAVADASNALAMGRAALESSEERLSLAQEAGGIGNWDWDLASGDVTMSATCRRLLKLSPNAPTTARALLDAIHPEDRSRVEAALDASLSLGAPYDQEFRVIAADGSVCWLMSRAEVLRGPEGAPYRVVGIVADITARREAEEKVAQALVELATSVQQKEVLLREVNHRVKNSLAIVSSLLAMQSRRIADPEVRRPFIEASERVRTVAAVHERLYRGSDLNRMDAGLFVRDLVNDLRAAGLMVDTAVRLTTETVIIGADQSVVLGLILNELLTNADKYGRPTGRQAEVAVSLRGEAAGYVLTVADNGHGVAAGINPLQADGLGMRLVRALARQLQAELRLSRPERGGLAFHIHVPVNKATDVPPLEATG
jgi:two-component sensor histidine kinase/PAS domain-containing protein